MSKWKIKLRCSIANRITTGRLKPVKTLFPHVVRDSVAARLFIARKKMYKCAQLIGHSPRFSPDSINYKVQRRSFSSRVHSHAIDRVARHRPVPPIR